MAATPGCTRARQSWGQGSRSGSPRADSGRSYLRTPDTQLNEWGEIGSAVGAHYGAASLFVSYFADRYGGYGAVGRLIALGTRGPDAFDGALREMGIARTFESVFREWLVATYVGASDPNSPHRTYDGLTGRPASVRVESLPYTHSDEISAYGADYVEIPATGSDIVVEFEGASSQALAGPAPIEGGWEWWSNRGDLIDSRLTRDFDLPSKDRLTLSFNLWFDAERGFDFCYVELSEDGETWKVLKGVHSTSLNTTGLSFGEAYTGRSGPGPTAGWIEERIDLTPWAGKKVKLRFEYVTDDAYNAEGVGIDSIAIPEIGYLDGAEGGDGGWVAEGFTRTRNVVTPRYSVQVFSPSGAGEVRLVDLDPSNRGRITFRPGAPNADGVAAVVVIAGETRYTRRPTEYKLSIRPAR